LTYFSTTYYWCDAATAKLAVAYAVDFTRIFEPPKLCVAIRRDLYTICSGLARNRVAPDEVVSLFGAYMLLPGLLLFLLGGRGNTAISHMAPYDNRYELNLVLTSAVAAHDGQLLVQHGAALHAGCHHAQSQELCNSFKVLNLGLLN
jgi:hypothetical protein